MRSLFVSENDEFTVKFSVAIDEKGTIFSDINKESLIESFGESIDSEKIEDYEAVFKRPSFGDSVELYNSIFSLTANGSNVDFNPVLARYNKIVALIKRWNLQGEESTPTEEDIRKLHPTIAMVIGIQLDAETGGIFG